jgi:hypothetical protein
MNFDDVLFGLIVCGIGLAGACFRSEYLLLRDLRTAERSRQRAMRKLQLERLSNSGLRAQRRATTQTAVMNPAQLVIDEVARPEDA